MDQQLQEGLSLSREVCVDAEMWAQSANLIGQKWGAELPKLFQFDVFQEFFQSRRLL